MRNVKLFKMLLKNKLDPLQLEHHKKSYFDELRNFNKLKRRKEREFWNGKKRFLSLLQSNNPKEFWKNLKLKHSGVKGSFEKRQLFEIFSKLAENDVSEDEKLDNDTSDSEILGTEKIQEKLDKNIEKNEIKKVINSMKNGRAARIDKIIPELLKSFDENMLDLITFILNFIFVKDTFPEDWAVGVVVILHKDGDTNDLNNFRGITLLSMLGKLLIGVLNNRLSEVLQEENLLNENQAGFRKGYRTTGHIFALLTLINHYKNVKKMKLYVCSVDFRKAFNKVSHSLLWAKLINYGIGGKFMKIIISMYEQVKSCVRARSGLTDFFQYRCGLRQGCLLSPVFFALFLNDLQENLFEMGAKGVNLWDINICTLLYADDQNWDEIERIHLYFCKLTLGIKPSTPTDGIYAELGRYPLKIFRQIQMIKFAIRISNLNGSRYANKALTVLIEDDMKGYYNWFSQVTDIVKSNDIVDENDNNESIKKKIIGNYNHSLSERINNCDQGKN